MKPLFCTLILLTILAPMRAWADDAPPATVTAESHTTPDNLTITPLEVERDEAADEAHAQCWRFKVQTPQTNAIIYFVVVFYGSNHKVVPLLGGPLPDAGELELALSLAPQDADSLSIAAKLDNSIWVRVPAAADDAPDYSVAQSTENPFQGVATESNLIRPQKWFARNGDVTLYEIETVENGVPIHNRLVLRIETIPPRI